MSPGGVEKPGPRELTNLPNVTGPVYGDSNFKQAPKCGASPSGRRKVNVHSNLGVGLGNLRPVSLIPLVSKWTFSKTSFSLSSRKRREKSREDRRYGRPVGFLSESHNWPVTEMSLLPDLQVGMGVLKRSSRPPFFLRAQTFQLKFHPPWARALKASTGRGQGMQTTRGLQAAGWEGMQRPAGVQPSNLQSRD